MKILSWNINSIRLRELALARLLRRETPDVVCLQETKVVDSLFPLERFHRLGYRYSALAGQKSYNGVAILSKLPLRDVTVKNWCGRRDCRHIFATVGDVLELHNLYVPAGGDLPDPGRNAKFAHKLQFLRSLARWFRGRGDSTPTVLAGDLNVAPLRNDVWSHEKLKRVVTHTEVEVEALERLGESIGFRDTVRSFVPESEKIFSWWSYRAPDWRHVDKGRRLDHIWVTESARRALVSATILKRVRGWRLPSDHAPVVAALSL
jgi:exodeoxyribonuclease-3